MLQRIVRHRIGPQRPTRAIERARDRGSLARYERARAGIEPQRLGRADLCRRPAAPLLELAGQRLGLRRVRLVPRGRLADEDLEIIDGAPGDLLGRRIPRPPSLAYATRERFEATGGAGDRLLICH